MKARLIDVGLPNNPHFHIKLIEQNHFETPLHFHELCEINYITHSHGKRMVGDHVGNFCTGDVVLIGPNLPHIWFNDTSIYKDPDTKNAKAVVVYFPTSFLYSFSEEPDIITMIQTLINRSQRGMQFYGETKQRVIDKISEIINKKGLSRIIGLLEIVNIMIDTTEYDFLASVGYTHSFNEKDRIRMNKVYRYLMKNFGENISLRDAANVANMTPPAFCSYFKKRTNKSFSGFLNELRVGHACKLLQNSDDPIKAICFESGFKNFTSFNKTFKHVTNLTPSQYRKT